MCSTLFDRFAEVGRRSVGATVADRAADWLRARGPNSRFELFRLAMDVGAADAEDEAAIGDLLTLCCTDLGILDELAQITCPLCGARVDEVDVRRAVLTSGEPTCPLCDEPVPDFASLPRTIRYRLTAQASDEARAWQAEQAEASSHDERGPVTNHNQFTFNGPVSNSQFGDGNVQVNEASSAAEVLAEVDALVRAGLEGRWDARAADAVSRVIDARADIDTPAVEAAVSTAIDRASPEQNKLVTFGQSVAAGAAGGTLGRIVQMALGIG